MGLTGFSCRQFVPCMHGSIVHVGLNNIRTGNSGVLHSVCSVFGGRELNKMSSIEESC